MSKSTKAIIKFIIYLIIAIVLGGIYFNYIKVSRLTKTLIKFAIYFYLAIVVLAFIIDLIETYIELQEKKIKELKKQGLYVSPPSKKVKQYWDFPPEDTDYEKCGLINIEDSEAYKSFKAKYKDCPSKEPTGPKGAGWFIFVLLIATGYMFYKIFFG